MKLKQLKLNLDLPSEPSAVVVVRESDRKSDGPQAGAGGSKKCSRCHEELPLSSFNKHVSRPGGVQRWCRLCQAECKRHYRSSEKGKEVRRRYLATDKGRKVNLASQLVQQEVRMGRLPPVWRRKCEHCGSPAESYHHHMGYSEAYQLNVIPLCWPCHRKAHQEEE
jgi:hypothetical protein